MGLQSQLRACQKRLGVLLALLCCGFVLPATADQGVQLPGQSPGLPREGIGPGDGAASRTLEDANRQIASGRFHDAIAALQRASTDEKNEPRVQARILGTLGVALNQAGAFGEAIEVQQRALALFESLEDAASVTAVTLNLGSSLSGLGDLPAARRHLEDALAQKRQLGVDRGVGAIHNNLAELAEREGDLNTMLAELEQALAAHIRLPDTKGESIARGNLARTLARLGRHDEALEQLRQAEALAQADDFQVGLLAAQAAHANVLMEYARHTDLPSDEHRQVLAQAGNSLQRALAASEALDDTRRRIRLLEAMSELAQMQDQPAQALEQLRQARALDLTLRERTDLARADVLSARYEQERQQREIQRLRERETRATSVLAQQRTGLTVLAGLLVMALAVAVALWQRNRERRARTRQLHHHNAELAATLQQADHERQRAETFALRQRRFLRLASEDLRGPLLEVRTLAERALVDENPESRRRSHAAIAQHAADLIWVTEQMLESADHEAGEIGPSQTETFDLLPVLRDILDQAASRALHVDQHIELQAEPAAVQVTLERVRCTVALRELIDILLYVNPPRTHFVVRLHQGGDWLRIGLSAGVARLPDWQDVALGQNTGDVTLRLALAWIQHAVQDNGGGIGTERDDSQNRREVVIRFPLAGAATPAVMPVAQAPT